MANGRGNTRAALKGLGCNLVRSDRDTDWFTVPSEHVADRFYKIRFSLQVGTTLSAVGRVGGLIVHYSQMQTPE